MKQSIERKILQAMKVAGHDRLEDIVNMGVERQLIYRHLANRMHLRGSERHRAHFGKMRSKKEVERAISLLEDIRMKIGNRSMKVKKTIPPKKEKLKPAYLTSHQKRIAMRRLRRLKHPLIRWLWLTSQKSPYLRFIEKII